jgi:hypothetical protein
MDQDHCVRRLRPAERGKLGQGVSRCYIRLTNAVSKDLDIIIREYQEIGLLSIECKRRELTIQADIVNKRHARTSFKSALGSTQYILTNGRAGIVFIDIGPRRQARI